MAEHGGRWWFVPFVVLGLIIVVDVIRQAWPDAIFFLVALIVAALQQRHGALPRHQLTGTVPVPGILWITAVAFVVLSIAPRYSVVTIAVVGLVGLVFLTVAALGRHPEPGDGQPPPLQAGPLTRAVIAWGAVLVTAALWELTAYLTMRFGLLSDGVMPSISDVINPLMDSGVGKVIFIALWLAGGAALLIRAWRVPAAKRTQVIRRKRR